MTLRDLEIFCAVCDTNNMTAAAERLHISQSSVSQVITNIEKEYGICLFERFSKNLYITETGRLLQDYARHLISSFDEMTDRLHGFGVVHTIRVGASVTIGACLLTKIVQNFSKINPDVRIEAVVDNTSTIEEQILKNDLDVGLVEGNIHNSNLRSIPFMNDELVLVCGRSHPLYRKSIITQKELGGLPFIIREKGSGTRELFSSVMNASGVPWHPIWVCNNAESIKNAVIAGIGVTVISKMLLENEIKSADLHIVKIEDLTFKRDFHLVYHQNKYLSEPLRQLIDSCLNSKKDLSCSKVSYAKAFKPHP